jgi:hypothetical protein
LCNQYSSGSVFNPCAGLDRFDRQSALKQALELARIAGLQLGPEIGDTRWVEEAQRYLPVIQVFSTFGENVTTQDEIVSLEGSQTENQQVLDRVTEAGNKDVIYVVGHGESGQLQAVNQGNPTRLVVGFDPGVTSGKIMLSNQEIRSTGKIAYSVAGQTDSYNIPKGRGARELQVVSLNPMYGPGTISSATEAIDPDVVKVVFDPSWSSGRLAQVESDLEAKGYTVVHSRAVAGNLENELRMGANTSWNHEPSTWVDYIIAYK